MLSSSLGAVELQEIKDYYRQYFTEFNDIIDSCESIEKSKQRGGAPPSWLCSFAKVTPLPPT